MVSFFSRKDLVVLGVLRERGELLEGVVHVARPRVERGVMLARRLVDRLRIGRQLVVEAVEIDALAALDQPVDVRPAEIEMPQQRAFEDLVPRPDAGQRRVDHHPFGDAVGILRGERVADHVADVVGDEIGLLRS